MTAMPKPLPEVQVPELHNGDQMTQPEFHRIYSQMPKGFKAELIGGIVYLASPRKLRHGNRHTLLSAAFALYEGATPGVEVADNTTVILGDEGEPQPDLFMRILPEHGGQSGTTADDYVDGAPELVAEVSHTTLAIDLHKKKDDYARYGVQEYLVLSVREGRLFHFDLRAGHEVGVNPDNMVRVRTFPGFWIDVPALVNRDINRLMATLQQGLTTPEHAAFVERLRTAAG
jgi:Uma2 family endonuclease